jgi:hypothetical protein
MALSTQTKGKRALRLFLGFNAGADAFDAAGNAVAGATVFEVTRMPGDFALDQPGEGDIDPLDRGQVMFDQAPILTDDQGMSGSFTSYYTEETDPAALALLDILNERGFAASLPSVVANSERLYCDIKRTYTHPGNPADVHGTVFRQSRLTFSQATADPVTITVNWKSRETRPSISF